jgi:putative endonuclease
MRLRGVFVTTATGAQENAPARNNPIRSRARAAVGSHMASGIHSDPDQWRDPRQRLGLASEQQAIRFLQSRGWDIVAHRFRAGRAELDLVARRGHLVSFIEVKARRGTAFGSPFEAVTAAKRREIVKAARVWMDRFGQPGDVYRFDCIGIIDNTLEHIEDAFRPGWR